MLKDLFTQQEIESDVQTLAKTIYSNSCSIKIENRSPYALDIKLGMELIERVNPYAFIVLKNNNYTVELNKSIKAENVESTSYIYWKEIKGDVQEMTGSTTFTGTINVSGDMFVTGGQMDVQVKGDVNIAPGTEVNANITGPVNIAEGSKVEANIVGDVKLSPDTEVTVKGNVNIAPGSTVQAEIVSGTVEANINNAEIKTELLNTSISTNPILKLNTPDQEQFRIMGRKSSAQVEQLFQSKFKASVNNKIIAVFDITKAWTSPIGIISFEETSGSVDEGEFKFLGLTQVFIDFGGTAPTTMTERIKKQDLILGGWEIDESSFPEDYIDVPFNRYKVEMTLSQLLLLDEMEIKVNKYLAESSSMTREIALSRIQVYGYNENFFEDEEEVQPPVNPLSSIEINGRDLNNILEPGIYTGSSLINGPFNNTAGYVTVKQYNNGNAANLTNYVLQEYTSPTALNSFYFRKKIAGTWTNWRALEPPRVRKTITTQLNLPQNTYQAVPGLTHTVTTPGEVRVVANIKFTNLTAISTGRLIYVRVGINGAISNDPETYINYELTSLTQGTVFGEATFTAKKGDVLSIQVYSTNGTAVIATSGWSFAEFYEIGG